MHQDYNNAVIPLRCAQKQNFGSNFYYLFLRENWDTSRFIGEITIKIAECTTQDKNIPSEMVESTTNRY